MEARQLLKDKKFWVASFLIAWAAALQGHMMWVQRQDSYKQKFGTLSETNTNNVDKPRNPPGEPGFETETPADFYDPWEADDSNK